MKAVVALGANLEEPRKAIELAIELLKRLLMSQLFHLSMKRRQWVDPNKKITSTQ